VVSARATPDDVQAARDAGADEWLAKPFSIGDLRSVVQQFLPRPPLPEAPG
jgi:DNA-binding response OmpR family regulator